jgi:hypothetical protein
MLSSLKALALLSYLSSPILGLVPDRQRLREREDQKVTAGPYKSFIREEVTALTNENKGRYQLIE